MKKLSIVALFALILISSAFANKTSNPDFIGMENFNKTFPQATDVVCKIVDRYTEVSFTWHNLKLQAFYDMEGNPVGTSRKIALADLPLPYQLNIKKEYPDFQPTEVMEFDHTDSGVSYYITVVAPQKAYVLQVSADGAISVFKKMKN